LVKYLTKTIIKFVEVLVVVVVVTNVNVVIPAQIIHKAVLVILSDLLLLVQ